MPDPIRLLRDADVPQGLRSGLDTVSRAARETAGDLMDHVPGRRRRRRRAPMFLVLAGGLSAIAIAAWWTVRGSAAASARALAEEEEADGLDPDLKAVGRVADDGKGTAIANGDLTPLAARSGV